jgi:signal-transduction protein with cAMP-binding, CBS, and nucleotidyltransferase domain
MMVGGRVHRLIVTRGDQVVGIVTTLDLLRGLRATSGEAAPPGLRPR